MRSCNHEAKDTQILVHVKDALAKGGRSVLVRTVDTDVLVILITQFHTLSLTWPRLSFLPLDVNNPVFDVPQRFGDTL